MKTENHKSQTVKRWESDRWESVTDEMAAILRQKTGAERLAITFGMWRFAQQMVSSAVKQEHPDWPDSLRQKEVARRMSHGAV